MRNFLIWPSKYFSIPGLLVIGLIVYLIFFQENSVGQIYTYRQTIDSLETRISVYRDTFEFYHSLNERLDNRDPAILERIARERHDMNMENEDVYVFK
ncbi:MAG: septum formation initiator family protein [Muribaculaceae bacterium]|nr:septum formation initiator family protein [Muribaculaceae bacterium]